MRQHTSASVSIRQHTSAYVSIRQHTSAYVLRRTYARALEARLVGIEEREGWEEAYGVATLAMLLPQVRLHTSACVSIRQHTSAYGVAARLLQHIRR
jgi:hypothetical protein